MNRAAATATLSLFCLAASSGVCAQGPSPPLLDMPALGIPFESAGLLCGARMKRCAGILSAFTNPYMIDGLIVSSVRAGYHVPLHSLWLGWRHMGHPLYREDRISVAVGLGLPKGLLRVAALPSVERREAKGFAAALYSALSIAASCGIRESVYLGVERLIFESEPENPHDAAIFLHLDAGSLAVALDRTTSGWYEGDTNIRITARLRKTCRYMCAYRSAANEISSGLLIEVQPLIFAFSWSQNPALGSTVSIGVGRLWKW